MHRLLTMKKEEAEIEVQPSGTKCKAAQSDKVQPLAGKIFVTE